jgi:hypothetical protein
MPVFDDGKRLAAKTHLNSATSREVPLAAEKKSALAERKAKFESINKEISAAGGWVISICGNPEIDFEIIPGNPLTDQIRASGYEVGFTGYGERILPHSKVEFFTKNADGTLSLLTEGSTQPVSSRVTHAGIHRTEQYWFNFEKKTPR